MRINFFSGDDDESETGDVSSESVDSWVPRTRLGEAYAIDERETTYVGGKPVLTETATEGPVAGPLVRRILEECVDEDEPPLWIGYDDRTTHGFREAGLPFDSLFRHIWVTGTTGYGKSTMLVNMLVQHAYADHGFVYVDPKGQDSLELLRKLPEHRLDDVIWVEPGTDRNDKTIGLNFLEVPDCETVTQREEAIENRLETLKAVLDTSEYWGIDMESITESMGRAMMQSEKPFSVIDMYFTLLGASRRDAFAEDVEDPYVREYCREIAKMDDETVRPLLKRIKSWIESTVVRKIIAHRESTIDFQDVIDNDRIVIVRTPIANRDIKKLITLGVIQNVWSAVQKRSYECDDPDPYFVVCDEFNEIASKNLDIESMLARARSMGLSVTLACQYPSQLDEDTRTAALNNCDNLLAFSVNDVDDATILMKRFEDYHAEDLLFTDQYKLWTKLPLTDGRYSRPVVLNAFAPYPPLRPASDVDDVIDRSLERYGTDPLTDGEIARSLIYGDIEAPYIPLGETMASAIRTVQIRQDVHGDNDWVDVEAVDEELARRLGRSDVDMDYALDDLPEVRRDSELIDVDLQADSVVVRLTEEGEAVTRPDTGPVSASGGPEHDALIEDAETALTKCGFSVDVLEQDGSSMPDGIATHPAYDVTFALEAEMGTLERPSKVLQNLARALEDGCVPLFVVRPGNPETENASRIENMLSPPVKVPAGGIIRYYNRDSHITFNGGATANGGLTAIRPATHGSVRTVWRKDDGDLVLTSAKTDLLRVPLGDPLSRDVFPACYSFDRATGRYTVYERGNVTQYDSTEAFEEDWTPIKRPFVPELDLPDDFSPDSYVVVIIPEDGHPMCYNGGDTYPLTATEVDLWPTEASRVPVVTTTDIEGDGVDVFAGLYVTENADAQVPLRDVFEAYTTWADEQDLDAVSRRWFGRKLHYYADFESERIWVDGTRVMMYSGIELTGNGEALVDRADSDDK